MKRLFVFLMSELRGEFGLFGILGACGISFSLEYCVAVSAFIYHFVIRDSPP